MPSGKKRKQGVTFADPASPDQTTGSLGRRKRAKKTPGFSDERVVSKYFLHTAAYSLVGSGSSRRPVKKPRIDTTAPGDNAGQSSPRLRSPSPTGSQLEDEKEELDDLVSEVSASDYRTIDEIVAVANDITQATVGQASGNQLGEAQAVVSDTSTP
jgi:hypothetical protein